jgi:rSAM/selenodomain-associated transferase 1
MRSVALLVIAKPPLPGRAKTRLTPPCSTTEAAALAEAALFDTLDALTRTETHRRVMVFDGDGERWRPPGFEVIAQRGEGLAERLAAAFEDVGEPALLVGMDTPQVTPELLREGIDALNTRSVDAVIGPARDGGYWSIGLNRPQRDVFAGVPMSADDTCAAQKARIAELGLRLHEQPPLTDVDTIVDARVVARQAPASRFARTLAGITC